jgi:hypothetical protein
MHFCWHSLEMKAKAAGADAKRWGDVLRLLEEGNDGRGGVDRVKSSRQSVSHDEPSKDKV